MNTENYSLTFNPMERYMYARVSGVRTLEIVTQITQKIFEETRAKQLSRVLIDVRELQGRLGVLESYILATRTFERIRGKGIEKAAVLDLREPGLRDWFLETVARNRGFQFRIFSEQDAAKEWLAGN